MMLSSRAKLLFQRRHCCCLIQQRLSKITTSAVGNSDFFVNRSDLGALTHVNNNQRQHRQQQWNNSNGTPVSPLMSQSTSIQSFSSSNSGSSPVTRRRRRRSGRGDGTGSVATAESENSFYGEDDGKLNTINSRKKRHVFETLDEFITVASECIDKLHNSLKPLQSMNSNMIVTRGIGNGEPELLTPSEDAILISTCDDDEEPDSDALGEYLRIDLGPTHGLYVVQVNFRHEVIRMRTPISGYYAYFYNDKEWISTYDGHQIEGLFVRDLIRQIHGVPNL